MTLTTLTVPSLTGGISQQASSIRGRSSNSDELNAIPSLVSGAQKRPSTEWIAKVLENSVSGQDTAVHPFTVASGKVFALLIDQDPDTSAARATVVDLEGTTYSVDLSGDGGYISGSTRYRDTFRFLTIGDTTFILNRQVAPGVLPVAEDIAGASIVPTVTVDAAANLPDANNYLVGAIAWIEGTSTYYVAKRTFEYSNATEDPDYQYLGRIIGTAVNTWVVNDLTGDRTRKDPELHATVYIRQAVHSCLYKATIEFADGTSEVLTYTTEDPAESNGDPNYINTEIIVNGLVAAADDPAITATAVGASVSITSTKEISAVVTEDGFGDQAMNGYSDSVQVFEDVAPNEANGRVVRISGSVLTGGDDYFVEFQDGTWQETTGYGAQESIDGTTMPFKLVYNSVTDSFTLQEHTWEGRTSGDQESAPTPSFVGRAMNDMFLFKGRLGFLADEDVLLSQVGFFENFYRTTLTQYLETDPIILASPSPKTSILHHAIPFNKTMVIFSGQQQYRLITDDSLRPDNVEIVPTTTYDCSATVRPEQVGRNVMFIHEPVISNHTQTMEYFQANTAEQDDANSLTEAVPNLIPKGVFSISAAANDKLTALVTSGDPTAIYVYSYYWKNNEKVLSSWTRWNISGISEVVAAKFSEDVLYVWVRASDSSVHLLATRVDEGRTDGTLDMHVHMDLRVSDTQVSKYYDPDRDITEFLLPYPMDTEFTDGSTAGLVLIEDFGDFPAGYYTVPVSRQANRLQFDGDLTEASLVLGISFPFYIKPSPPYVRVQVGAGETPALDNRFQLRRGKLYFTGTVAFDVEVTPEGRKTSTSRYTGKFFNDPSAVLNKQHTNEEHFSFPLAGRNDRTEVIIRNDEPFPSKFISLDWSGLYYPKATRA